jgi:hypothetical protein
VTRPILHKDANKPKTIGAGANLLTCVASACDLEIHELAVKTGIEYGELRRLSKGPTGDTDIDPLWAQLHGYVNERIAQLLAARQRLDHKMYADGQARIRRQIEVRK